MTRYIAFLRAINVGGRTVSMEKLRGYFAELGFANVRSYIQTGNLFFETSETNTDLLAQTIEAHLLKVLEYTVPTMVRNLGEVEALIAANPFSGYELTSDTRFCVAFGSKSLPKNMAFPHISPDGEYQVISAQNRDACIVIHQKDRPGNPGAYLEKTYGVVATVRFYHTLLKIVQAAKG